MGWFDWASNKKGDDEDSAPKVEKSKNSVALAKQRLGKTKSERQAQEAEWAKDDEELARYELRAEHEAHETEAPARVSDFNPAARPAKPAAKGCMKKQSRFAGDQSSPPPGADLRCKCRMPLLGPLATKRTFCC